MQREPHINEDLDLWTPVLHSLQLVEMPVTYKDIREATVNDSVLKTFIQYINHEKLHVKIFYLISNVKQI